MITGTNEVSVFLKSEIFYFQSDPEEMYYVTSLGDDNDLADAKEASLAIRAVHFGKGRWLNFDDFNQEEIDRITKRFDGEIIQKLKQTLKVNLVSCRE